MTTKNPIQWTAIVLTALAIALAAPGANASKATMDVQLGTPVMLGGLSQTAYLKVGLTGFPLEGVSDRAGVNLSIVLDRSGSMSGDKMRKAKEAAIMAIEKLGPNDIVSVVAYNHAVEVIVPATKVRDRYTIYRAIENLYPSGNTALFAGVSKGAGEVRKFTDRNRANRVILLSDGLANVGPSTPGDLGTLGWSLAKEGISVTTIGLGDGYNEDLMVALAGASDGNHAFAENAGDLAAIFSYELGDLLSVVAREIHVEVRCAPGIQPIRVLGRRAEINGRNVVADLTQLYAGQEKFLLIEVRIPPQEAGSKIALATVDVRYANTLTQSTDMLGATAYASFTDSMAMVDQYRNNAVMVASVELIASESAKNAIALRDSGRIEDAEQALELNARFLETQSQKYKSKKLEKAAGTNRKAKDNLEPTKWKKQRKVMFDDAFAAENQQAW